MSTIASQALPKLRADLRIQEQATDGETVFVLKDPVTQRFFRFREAELFLTRQLDGETSLAALSQRMEEHFGQAIAADQLQAFLDHLRRLDLLEPDSPSPSRRLAEPRRVGGDLFYLRWRAFDPDRLFTWLLPKVRLCFTPAFLVGSAALILFAFGLTLVHGAEIRAGAIRLFRLETLVLVWWTILGVTTLHEFAHGLTCKRFGGEVHELGFMLIYFQPAFYCNVSDAWLFPKKAHRLWVTFAGAYFELFLWALAALVWRLSEPGTWVSSAALVVVVTSAVRCFFNLNPLIKLDGYYLLSDLLNVPNLRFRSSQHLRSLLARVLWGQPAAAAHAQPVPSRRERRIFVLYGLLAGAFSLWLLGSIAWWACRFFVQRYQGTGFLIFVALLALLFRRSVSRAIRGTWSRLRPRRAPTRPAAATPTPPPKSGSGGLGGFLRRGVWLALLLGAVAAALVVGRMELKVASEFSVLPARRAEIHSDLEGVIEELGADEGDEVSAGDLIARLADREVVAELAKAEATIQEKRALLRRLTAGPRREEIDLARAALETARTCESHAAKRHEEAEALHRERAVKARTDLAKAEKRREFGRSELVREQSLFESGLSSREQLELCEEKISVLAMEAEAARSGLRLVEAESLATETQALAAARRQVAEAEARLELLLAGSRPEDIDAAQAEMARWETERGLLRDRLERLRLRSPIAGVITTPKLREKVGLYAHKGDLVAEVHELRSVAVEMSVSERDVSDVFVGQDVELKTRAHPDRIFRGKVESIAPAAARDQERWGQRFFRVTTRIDNPDLLLRPEMTGAAKIHCGERPIWEILTRRLARYVRVEFWSWW